MIDVVVVDDVVVDDELFFVDLFHGAVTCMHAHSTQH